MMSELDFFSGTTGIPNVSPAGFDPSGPFSYGGFADFD